MRLLVSMTTALCIALSAMPAWSALDIKGVHFNDTYNVGGQALQLNGGGVRVRIVIDVYAAALYLSKKERQASSALSQTGAKSLQIVLLRDLQGEDFVDALLKGFRKNHSEADVARYQSKLDELKNLMQAFGNVKKGTAVHLDLTPGGGTQILVNGERKGNPIAGDDFYNALLRIWLGSSPVDSDLKDSLLGTK